MSNLRAPVAVAAVAVAAVGVWLVSRGKTDVVTVETTTSVPAASSAPVAATPPPSAMPSASANAEAPPAVVEAKADAGAAATAEASHAKAAASASGKPVASAASASASAGAAVAGPLQASRTRVDGKNFALEVSSPGCRVGADCTMTIRLAAVGDYHVNKEYPYKFLAQAAPEVAYLGKDDPNTFSRSAGDFREEGEKAATMTVRFRPKASGDAKLSGTYKMSVCSAENCQIETPRVELTVAVK